MSLNFGMKNFRRLWRHQNFWSYQIYWRLKFFSNCYLKKYAFSKKNATNLIVNTIINIDFLTFFLLWTFFWCLLLEKDDLQLHLDAQYSYSKIVLIRNFLKRTLKVGTFRLYIARDDFFFIELFFQLNYRNAICS